ncbi:MAG: histidinol dehydrogenase [Chloroflexi bacterium GWB2_49_20]|nr:MAG: histidinol dehydrogenase [Chloroflexi bacterium GWB2_49_20]OGN77768.1 MAG: histidinol dehydrogenase [Chloroflexi bacterium GWC2_49_37]OGN86543.1 MAG: histidinol dehydrogenase [Chloroflexi bacterium GWD2_49_16]HBG74797.1 histidinol dehydrogenase [Anaerolineae bacterium]
MLKQYDARTSKQTILKRTPPDEFPVSQRVLDGITQLFGESLTPEQAVSRILKDVRMQGDVALQKWTQTLDSINIQPAPVSKALIQSALDSISPAERDALEKVATRIEAFHRHQPLTSWFTNELGGTLGQIIRPIQRVGLYVPGGTAPLPSTVLMSAIPARVAGVKEIIVVTPPNRFLADKNPPVEPMILAACCIAGVDKIYLLGGVQAIAALAYGTETIQPVDKIFGPGNLFVMLAKRQVYGVVGIDGLAGPTETLIIADESANPAWVAADLLAQAEHDLLASAILLTPSDNLFEKVQIEVAQQIEQRGRADIILASLENRGGAVVTRDLEEAVQLANDYAPEHLVLSVSDPWRWVEKVNNAGGVFVGEYSFEVLGDYAAGPSHVMPTGGSARFASPLNVWDFVKIISLVALDENTVHTIGPISATIAKSEGLDAHNNAALIRLGRCK